ncbi:hypothetical protein ADIAL_0111 [Alkalibacterium sp. AK22]|uniref:hypothetical protein n=1 Tax=Alkalibacterium sp. AK22 TaxID=1229520 RepID=UPI0004483273|nr:hypothetical protein [Alkalibacterium sp. AK22]EXJ24372.1 hypothetical protein ADIAL_0111 [Alkalibacterium sp. AK22]
MNDISSNGLKDNDQKKLQQGKASSWFGVFIVLTTVTLLMALIFAGFLLLNFINTP